MNSFFHNLNSFAKTAFAGAKELKNLSLSKLRKVFSLMGKKEKLAVGLLLLIAAVSVYLSVRNFYYNHTNPVAAYGGSFTEGLVGQPTYINPLLARMEPDMSLTKLVFSGLYKYDSNGQLIADLADGMPVISEDQKSYTVNLKHDLKWHNDKPITADDVIFTLQLLKDPAFKSPLRPLWATTNIEKISDYSFKFTTKDISGPFVDNLTLAILPKSVWSSVDSQNFLLSKTNLEAIGSGPYKIKEIKKLPSGKVQQITLEANTDYQGNPKINQIVFKLYDTEDDLLNAFHSREISAFGFTPLGSSLYVNQNQTQAQILTVPLPQYQIAFFNLNNKILADQNIRHALSLATDREQIIKDVFKGSALLPTSPFVFKNEQSQIIDSQTDLDKAKNLLDSAGWKIDSATNLRTNKKTAFEITIATNDSLVNSKAAETLANQWRNLGVKVNLNILPGKQLMETVIKPRAFDVLLFPQKFGADPDPFLFWHSSQIKDPGYNLTGFTDAYVDKLITDARTNTNRTVRAQKYAEFNTLIQSKFPIIFLDQTEFIYAVDSNIKNISFHSLFDPSQRFYGISDWYIATKRVWK